jgi:hypothetical protein
MAVSTNVRLILTKKKKPLKMEGHHLVSAERSVLGFGIVNEFTSGDGLPEHVRENRIWMAVRPSTA